jgi:asparagine synthase (glutamine-hydrolysing)
MCGIVGILDYEKNISTDLLRSMLAKIRYRGPDESGIYTGKNIGLGNVRLSIIDLISGQQPLSNTDKSLWIVYNGEIYNYIEVRDELVKLGYKFHTNSDTEVLLLLYQEYGEKCLDKINGQFAFAIWNKSKNQLFIARDRVGIRPLFYTDTGKEFIFGSEIKAILEYPDIKPELDINALSQIFTFWTTISPYTIFKNIYELPPGCYMRISRKGIEIVKYWQLTFPESKDEQYKGDITTAREEFHNLFLDSVKLRLRADVPVAAYLSGGIDSSTTTSYIKQVAYKNLNTYSIRFEDREFDETSYQEEVTDYLKAKHIAFRCTNLDISNYFPYVIWHSEIPILRTAPVPMYLLSKNVHEHNIKVVITGEGADEMLAGYNIFKEAVIREFWSRYPNSKYRPLLLQKLYPYISQFQGKNKSFLKFFFGYKLSETNSPVYSHLLRWHNTSRLQSYFSKDLQSKLSGYNPLNELLDNISGSLDNWSLLSRAQWLETNIFMSGYLLSSQGDRMAMANSVEGRYPFLDHRVIEFCARLPAQFKLRGLNEKYLLKKLMDGKLPQNVLKRSKQAYRAPISNSFFSKGSPGYVDNLLSNSSIKENHIFDSSAIKKIITKKLSGSEFTETENMAIAGILSTQLLIEQFINKKIKPELKENLKDCKIISETLPTTKLNC